MPTPAPRTSWWPQQLLLGWLNLALTAPLIYLYIGLPLVMRQNGWSGTQIGLMQLAGLPAMLKFLFATPVDRYRLGQASYRNWTLLLMLCYAAEHAGVAKTVEQHPGEYGHQGARGDKQTRLDAVVHGRQPGTGVVHHQTKHQAG